MLPLPDRITNVTYYNCNDQNPQFFYDEFHVTDLAIEIKFESGKFVHIGWSKNEQHEYIEAPYKNRSRKFSKLPNFSKIDATAQWRNIIKKDIQSIEVIYVNEELKIPREFICTTKDGNFVKIVLSERGHLDTLPEEMEYVNHSEIFVFINTQPPPIRDIRIVFVENDLSKHPNDFYSKMNIFNNRSIGLVMVIFALGASILYYILTRVA